MYDVWPGFPAQRLPTAAGDGAKVHSDALVQQREALSQGLCGNGGAQTPHDFSTCVPKLKEE